MAMMTTVLTCELRERQPQRQRLDVGNYDGLFRAVGGQSYRLFFQPDARGSKIMGCGG
jgi:hypothetical protein